MVSVHGYGRAGMWTTLLVGGGNRPLAGRVARALRSTMGDGFTVVDDMDAIPQALRGVHPRNPVNLPRRGGAQLELPPRVRPGTGAPTYRRRVRGGGGGGPGSGGDGRDGTGLTAPFSVLSSPVPHIAAVSSPD